MGETVTFTMAAENASSYQWQNSLDGIVWTDSGLPGNKTDTLSVPVIAARYPYLWRCVVQDPYGNVLLTDSVQILQP